MADHAGGAATAAMAQGEAATTGIGDLPESVAALVISLTGSPRAACRCAAVSPSFRAAAGSDAVWGQFLPPDHREILLRQATRPPPPSSSSCANKDAFRRLSAGVVLDDGTAVWLSPRRGRSGGGAAKCVALSARRLSLPWDGGELTWRWTPHPKSRFAEVAQLVSCTGLDIYGRLPAASLTPATDYAAYLVYGVADGGGHRGLSFPDQETTVAVGARAATRHAVCLRPDDDEARKFWGVAPANGVRRPAMRDDGWSEMEMGRLRVDESVLAAAAEEVVVSFEVLGWYHKSGLVVEAVEFRAV